MNNSEPPLSYKLWVGISVIASCLRRKCVLRWGDIDFYPNMYIVLVGPSGKCRKGTAMGPGFRLIREMGIKVSAEAITREALIRELCDANESHVEPKSGQMYLHSSLTIFSQELTVFLGYNNQQLMSDLADWYDCRDSWTYRTKHFGSDEIRGVWVNLIGATTPELIQTTLPRDAIGGGLTSRMIFVFENKKGKTVAIPFKSDSEIALERRLLFDLEQICLMSGEFKVTEAFVEEWIKWYTKADSSPPPFNDYRFVGYFERRATHLLKLSCIFSASRSNDMTIEVGDFKRALGLLHMTESMMPYTFSGFGRNPLSDITTKVMAIIASRGEILASEILRTFYNDIDSQMLTSIIKTVSNMNYAKVEPVDGGRDVRITYNKVKLIGGTDGK